MAPLATTLRSIAHGVLWVQCTLEVRLATEGWSWVIGRHARERAFVRRLLAEYPGLGEQPREHLNRVADRALSPLARWPSRIATLGAMVIGGFAAKSAWSVLFAWGAPLPPWTRPPAIAAVAICAGESIRRAYVRRDVARAIAASYPTAFCTCGYCLIGLPESVGLCPECGAKRLDARLTWSSEAVAAPVAARLA